MKGNQLNSEEVVSWRNARRHREGNLSLVGNHTFNSPFAIRGQTILPNFEPLETGGVGL